MTQMLDLFSPTKYNHSVTDDATPPSRSRPEPQGVDELEETAALLHSAAVRLLRRSRVHDTESSGLSTARLSALSVIVYGGPLRLTDLASAEQVTPATMTRLVDGLEEAGLVQRHRDPSDGRIRELRATRRGRAVLERARQERLRHLSEELRSLSQRELGLVRRAAQLLTRTPG